MYTLDHDRNPVKTECWYVRTEKSGLPSINSFTDVIYVFEKQGDLYVEGPRIPNNLQQNPNIDFFDDYIPLECPSLYAEELRERIVRCNPQKTIDFIESKLEQEAKTWKDPMKLPQNMSPPRIINNQYITKGPPDEEYP